MRVFHSISLAMVLLFCQCNVIDADELTSGPVFTEQVLLPTDLSQPNKAFSLGFLSACTFCMDACLSAVFRTRVH